MKKAASLVQISPRPTKTHRIEDPERAAELRRLDCRSYSGCLDTAAAQDWRGFHCNGCSAYEPLTPMERKRDHRALLDMLAQTQLISELRLGAATTDEVEEANDDDRNVAPGPRRGFVPDPEFDVAQNDNLARSRPCTPRRPLSPCPATPCP